jgi:hypothetical protein
MKESAKLHRPQKEREKKKLTKRLLAPSEASNDDKKAGGASNKRQNLGMRIVRRGAATQARRHIDEVRREK